MGLVWRGGGKRVGEELAVRLGAEPSPLVPDVQLASTIMVAAIRVSLSIMAVSVELVPPCVNRGQDLGA